MDEIYDEEITYSPLKGVNIDYNGIITGYHIDYCNDVLVHCGNGESIESFAGAKNIDPDSIQLWAKDHPEFRSALKCAISKEYFYWSTQLRESLADEALSFRLPSINRKMAQLESILLKNSIRRTLFANYEDVPELSDSESKSNELLNNFMKV